MRRLFISICACALLACAGLPAWAGMSRGQTLYVPCSSHIYHGVKTRPFDLTVTLIVRNTDPRRAMTLVGVDYVGSDGRLISRHLNAAVSIAPLATREFVVEQNDTSGGAGASFLVRWRSDAAINEPLAEAVMIGTSNSQGISFTSRGVAIQE